MSLADYCDSCSHKRSAHGDRAVGGICAVGQYPHDCPCTGYVNEGEAA